jgi:hypothetical protein
MKCINNVKFYAECVNHANLDVTIVFWSDYIHDLFPWREKWWINDYFERSTLHKSLESKFNNWISDVNHIEELYMIYENDEQVYGHGVMNFCRRIESFPKNVPILVTNFSLYMLELYDYFRKDGYNILDMKSVIDIICNKKIIVKNMYFDEHPCIVSMGGMYDFSNIRKLIHKDNIVFMRKDASTGYNRKLINSEDVRELFIKYNFVVIEKFSDLSFYEKKIYLNNFKNIFIEAGCGLINLFLIENPNNVNIYNLQAPSYDSSYVYSNISNLNVTSLEFGELCKDSPLYGNKIDPCNEPWKMNLEKLESILKNL